MRRAWRWIVPCVLLVAVAGCEDEDDAAMEGIPAQLAALRADHEALDARHQRVVAQLIQWTEWDDTAGGDPEVSLQAWLHLVGDAICDIVAKNTPATPYDPATRDFCSTSDPPQDPPDPPDWGQD